MMREIATVFVHPLIVRKKTGSKNISIPTTFSFKFGSPKKKLRMYIKKSRFDSNPDFKSSD